MQSYSVDIDPQQIVRWITAEHKAAPSKYKITARRSVEPRELPGRKELRLGDDERDTMSETATIATLQIAPARPSDGWLLTIVIEDEIGPSASEGTETVDEEEQEIDVDVFQEEFLNPGRGNANVIAEVTGPSGKTRLTRILNNIEKNRHVSTAPSRRAG